MSKETPDFESKLHQLILGTCGLGLFPTYLLAKNKEKEDNLYKAAEKQLIKAENPIDCQLNSNIMAGLGSMRIIIQKIAGVGVFLDDQEIIGAARRTYDSLNRFVVSCQQLEEIVTKRAEKQKKEKEKTKEELREEAIQKKHT
jgi:hypothetical protein